MAYNKKNKSPSVKTPGVYRLKQESAMLGNVIGWY